MSNGFLTVSGVCRVIHAVTGPSRLSYNKVKNCLVLHFTYAAMCVWPADVRATVKTLTGYDPLTFAKV